MIITLTEDRKSKIIAYCLNIHDQPRVTIRELACLIGQLIAAFSGVMYDPLNYRALERYKASAIQANKGNWEAKITLCQNSLREIEWWIQNLPMARNVISHGSPSLVITSDANNSGWGAVCNREKTCGHWTESEKSHYHINCLELMASFYALKSFAKDLKNTHIQLRLDNTSAP